MDELRLFEEELAAAIQSRDVAALERLLDDRFELRGEDGAPVTKTEFVRAVTSTPAEILSVELKLDSVQAAGDVGLVRGVQHAKVRLPDAGTVEDRQRFVDVCVVRDGRWRVLLVRSVPLAGD